MEFLNPAALYALFLLPFLLIPYLIKRKPRRVVFSSLLLLRDLSSRSLGHPWGRLHLPPIFFLQLLLLVLLILALAEPVFSVHPSKLAIIFDNSASMQALEGQKSRFELAQEQARELLRDFSSNTQVDLYLTVPRLERVGGEALAPDAASALIPMLRPYDLGEPPDSYGEGLSRLANEKSYKRIFLLTDHPVRGQDGTIRVLTTGRPKDNLAITSFQIAHPSFSLTQLEARAEVTSFSSREEKVKLLLKGGGKILSSRTQTVAPRKSEVVSFDGVPVYPAYEAEIELNDALALDNHRFAIPPASKGLEILAISPRAEALYSLRSIPGLNLKVISPEAYEKSGGGGHSLEIFHFSAPVLLPQKHALFVLPPKENPLVAVGGALSRPVISNWREPHPLTRYVNFALFRPAYARPLRPLSFGDALIESPEGAIAIGLEHQGFRYLVLGFDLFPYLGRENLPISLFTLNLLEWFYQGLGGSSTGTGEPLRLPAQPKIAILVTPNGEKFSLEQEQKLFSRTFSQGFYEVVRGEVKEILAVNLRDVRESDLANPLPIQLRGEPAASGSRSFFFSLWPYLLLLSILLLFLEWFFNPPATQP